uniref:Serine/threonine-protein kinase 1 n=1 Tax=Schmidtea mediterranea TaxID=79327 RepID=A0A2P1ERP6_SCHMD|nr:PIM-1 [Schmidtea mediterranea]
MNHSKFSKKLVVKSTVKYIQNKYAIYGKIGEGGFGKVFKSTKISNGKSVALKFVAKDKISEYCLHEETQQKIPMEAVLLAECQGIPGVIKLLEIVELEEFQVWCFVMERNPNFIDLFDYINRCSQISEETAVFILTQLIHTLIGCHKAGVAHRDIKDENILIDVDTKEIKLIDFGSGHYYHDGEYFDFNGTSIYSPPEWIKDKHYFVKELESWSIGALLYNMITGDGPFKNENEILLAPISIDSASAECRDLILSCLCRDRENRMDLDKILCHKLFQKYHMSIGIDA